MERRVRFTGKSDMKFINGNWMIADGITPLFAAGIFDYDKTEDSVTLYCPTRPIPFRQASIGLPLITYKVTSPLDDVIKVTMKHLDGIEDHGPNFQINESPGTVAIEEGEKTISFTAGKLTMKAVLDQPFSITYSDGEHKLTSTGSRSFGQMKDRDCQSYMTEQLSLSVGEMVYGFGEKFTPFVKNGQVIDVWNMDGGSGTWQAYKNIPMYITNKGYGIFVNDPGKVSFEVESQRNFTVSFSVPGEKLEYFIIYGKTPKEILYKYTALTGRPPLVPAWSMGLWLSTSFTTNYDEETVTSFIQGMEDRNLPLRVFHFDCFWMKEFQWCNFEWDERVFPNPEAMLSRLKARNLKICVWMNSYIGQRSPLFEEGKKNGYLLKRPDGNVWQDDDWQAGRALVDFTNPAACEWFASKLENLMRMGVDAFKTDFGERIPTDVVYYDGSDPYKMHNYYTYLYNKVVFDAIKKVKGEREAIVFARSATVGGQAFPVHWGGDCFSDYQAMAESLRAGLSLGLTGFGYWSHDIGGFEATSTPDIYKRWVAFGLLSSHSRLHGSGSYRVPWNYDDEAVEVLRFFTNLKMSLMPYLYGTAVQARDCGLPMARAMLLEFPEDHACFTLDRQYMLGDNLLVAPVFSDQGEVSYYLPHGTWTNIISNEAYAGGGWITETHGYCSLPLMARAGSILPVGVRNDVPDYDYVQDVTFHIFAPDGDKAFERTVYDTDGEAGCKLSVVYTGRTATFKYEGGKPYSILLRGAKDAKVSGAKAQATELGLELIPEQNASEIKAEF